MGQQYEIRVTIRRKGEQPMSQKVFKSGEFDDDEDYCAAISSYAIEQIEQDREMLAELEGM